MTDPAVRKSCDDAMDTLRNTFRSGKTRSYEWRIAQLRGMKRMYSENEDAIIEALKSDLGRSPFEAIGLEILSWAVEIDNALANLKTWMKPVFTNYPAMMAPATSEYVFEPYGVVLVIGSFNYPILLSMSPLLGAIIAGNCAVLKPSEVSKASEKLLVTLAAKYLDKSCIRVITGGVEMNTTLLDMKWDKIFFTGSTRVGKIVAQAAAKNLTPFILELGGKSPTIIDESCGNMELVCRRIIWGKLSNAGQTCIAPDYILCHSSKYEEFLATAVKVLKKFHGDDPAKSDSYSRIVTTQHCERLKGLLDGHGGGTLVVGGEVDVANRYVAPTIIRDVKMDSKLMSEEIFGPILPVIKYRHTDEVIAMINSETLQKPLALYIFSKDRGMVDKVIAACPSGGVVINDTVFHFGNIHIPFGGIGSSGMGGYHGMTVNLTCGFP